MEIPWSLFLLVPFANSDNILQNTGQSEYCADDASFLFWYRYRKKHHVLIRKYIWEGQDYKQLEKVSLFKNIAYSREEWFWPNWLVIVTVNHSEF